MKKFIGITLLMMSEALSSFIYWFKQNLRFFALVLEVLLPYFMYYIGMQREYSVVGGELAVPVVVILLVKYVRGYTDKIGKGNTFPVPFRRITTVSDDGERVTIEREHQEEAILYLANVEDWLERKGYANNGIKRVEKLHE